MNTKIKVTMDENNAHVESARNAGTDNARIEC
jgi:hypothetical protein